MYLIDLINKSKLMLLVFARQSFSAQRASTTPLLYSLPWPPSSLPKNGSRHHPKLHNRMSLLGFLFFMLQVYFFLTSTSSRMPPGHLQWPQSPQSCRTSAGVSLFPYLCGFILLHSIALFCFFRKQKSPFIPSSVLRVSRKLPAKMKQSRSAGGEWCTRANTQISSAFSNSCFVCGLLFYFIHSPHRHFPKTLRRLTISDGKHKQQCMISRKGRKVSCVHSFLIRKF